ncbi:hypothetical protein PTI98_011759 [Pleurotus ostreatus]|nr:hypothetical protein PTI98_011759 [Pleurotus ostreatus]
MTWMLQILTCRNSIGNHAGFHSGPKRGKLEYDVKKYDKHDDINWPETICKYPWNDPPREICGVHYGKLQIIAVNHQSHHHPLNPLTV